MEDTLQGMVINEIEGLDAEETQLLQSNYPRVNFDEVYIFEPDH